MPRDFKKSCPCPHHPFGCFGHPRTCDCTKFHSDPRLKPCPFCGTGASIVEAIKNDYGQWQIVCGCCGLHGGIRPDKNLEKTIEHWNTRRD